MSNTPKASVTPTLTPPAPDKKVVTAKYCRNPLRRRKKKKKRSHPQNKDRDNLHQVVQMVLIRNQKKRY